MKIHNFSRITVVCINGNLCRVDSVKRRGKWVMRPPRLATREDIKEFALRSNTSHPQLVKDLAIEDHLDAASRIAKKQNDRPL